MISELIIKPEAEEDISQAYDWYEDRRIGLGDYFLMSIEATLENIKRNPEAFLVKYKGVRRALVNRFPYVILFKEVKNVLIVLAVIHEKRDPDLFHQRATTE